MKRFRSQLEAYWFLGPAGLLIILFFFIPVISLVLGTGDLLLEGLFR